MHMATNIGGVEDRLKSFTVQLQTECGILERLVYKHKNQHRRCSYFQYVLKVRRDLKLLKSANLEDVLDSAFIVLNGNRPKQKVQLLESLKRRKCSGGKYNFLERLLGVSRLLSQIVEPLLKAAMEISTLLARSFFTKFSLTILSLLARIRVLVQQMLLDVVLVYNTVSSLSHTEQTVKLNQEGFEVFREYYPGKEKVTIVLECVWQMDKYVLLEKKHESETTSSENDGKEDVLPIASNIQYNNTEVLLGVDELAAKGDEINSCIKSGNENSDEKGIVDNSCGNTEEDGSGGSLMHNSQGNKGGVDNLSGNTEEDGLDDSLVHKIQGNKGGVNTSRCRLKHERKKVAFVAVKPPSTINHKGR